MIMNFKLHSDYAEINFEGTAKASIQTVEQLKKLFGFMTLSNKKYVDPSLVLNSLVDDVGNQLSIGDQKDVGEYNIDLVSRIEEGLKKSQPAPPPPAEIPIEVEEAKEEEMEHQPNRERAMSTNLAGVSSALIASELSDQHLITNKFYGKQVQIVTAAEETGELVQEEQTNPFGMVILDIHNKELYKAIDDAFSNEIEEYKTPGGHCTSATQQIWVTEIPSILLFQI